MYVLSDVGGGKNGQNNIANQILDKSVNLSTVVDVEAKNISRWYLMFTFFFLLYWKLLHMHDTLIARVLPFIVDYKKKAL